MTTINDNLYENDQSEHEGKRGYTSGASIQEDTRKGWQEHDHPRKGGIERGRASKKIQGQGQHATGIYPVVLKKLQYENISIWGDFILAIVYSLHGKPYVRYAEIFTNRIAYNSNTKFFVCHLLRI